MISPLTKIAAGIILALVIALSITFAMFKNEMQKVASLKVVNQELSVVNEQDRAKIKQLLADNEALGADMARFSKEQQRVIEQKNKKLKEAEKELEKLRSKNANVDNFLNVPVPVEFGAWLRHPADKDGNGKN